MSKELLSQNIKACIEVIGENYTLFKLYLVCNDINLRDAKNNWAPFKNLSAKGCDIILTNLNDNPFTNYKKVVKIEVKTRQKLHTTNKNPGTKNKVTFRLTETEYINCDFLVGYWLGNDHFYVVPKDKLKRSSKNGYVFTARIDKDYKPIGNNSYYIEQWDLIDNFIHDNLA